MVTRIDSGASRSMQSLQDMQRSMFNKVDQDGSGGLSVDEFSAMLKNGPNGASASSDASTTFASFDSDGDGSLSQTELDAGMRSLRGGDRSTVDRFGGMPPGPPPGPPPSGEDSGSTSDSTGTTSAPDATEAMAKKLSQMLQQMADAFASYGSEQASGLSVTA